MFLKIISYTLLSISTICIASEPPEKKWFTVLEERQGGKCRNGAIIMIIKCHCSQFLPNDFSPALDFEQNDHGSLFAVYNQHKQLIGCWPDRKLDITTAMTAWFYGENPTTEIQIEYHPKSKAPTN